MRERWIADFTNPDKSCFNIISENSYCANLEKKIPPEIEPRFFQTLAGFFKKSPSSKGAALFIGLKKKDCMAWVETANRVYVDQVIKARFRYDSMGGYCAAGIMFRVIEKGTYYLALVSSKGYFRLDAVNNNIPRPLIGWIEVYGVNEQGIELGIITRGDHHIFTLNKKWVAETYDSSIPGGHLGFALVSYDADTEEKNTEDMYIPPNEIFSCKAWLDYLSVNSRKKAVEAEYKKWNIDMYISTDSRMRLAEGFAALDRYDAAYDQITKVWKQRDEAARAFMGTYTETPARAELLFAAQMVSKMGQYAEAEEFIDTGLAMGSDDNGSDEYLDLLIEKAIALSAQKKYKELAEFLPGVIIQLDTADTVRESLPLLYSLLGYACWNLHEYEAAAIAWDNAFSLDKNNGMYAVYAADAWEKLGKKPKALKRLINGGNCFLKEKQYNELEALIPRLLDIGKKNKEACALAGEWAQAAGNKDLAEPKPDASNEPKKKPSKRAAAKAPPKTEKKPAGEKKKEKGSGIGDKAKSKEQRAKSKEQGTGRR